MDELARRFALEDVGHSAGVFDPEKLAWMNRHYMKMLPPARVAADSVRFFQAHGYVARPNEAGLAFIESLLPMAAGSVDRLEEIPGRLAFLFAYDARAALERDDVATVLHDPGARDVIAALPGAIDGPMVDRDAFRAMAARVKERTGHKGKALFQPLRLALTAREHGPELKHLLPLIGRERAAARLEGKAA